MPELQSAFSVTMGDDLLVEIKGLDQTLINGGVYVIPRGNNLFRVGSTYFRYPYTQSEEDGRNQVVGKLRKIIDAEIKVIDQKRAFRPNIKDRRPLIGSINGHKRIYSFNGMGSKGVLHAPLLAAHLADHLLNGVALMKEILPSRFLP
jgi:glycine/D-amino acid oxidase-like deaminating enzyme